MPAIPLEVNTSCEWAQKQRNDLAGQNMNNCFIWGALLGQSKYRGWGLAQ